MRWRLTTRVSGPGPGVGIPMAVRVPRMTSPIHRMHPFRELEDLYERMGQLLESAFGRETLGWTPAADFCGNADAYLLEAELPGVLREPFRPSQPQGARSGADWEQPYALNVHEPSKMVAGPGRASPVPAATV